MVKRPAGALRAASPLWTREPPRSPPQVSFWVPLCKPSELNRTSMDRYDQWNDGHTHLLWCYYSPWRYSSLYIQKVIMSAAVHGCKENLTMKREAGMLWRFVQIGPSCFGLTFCCHQTVSLFCPDLQYMVDCSQINNLPTFSFVISGVSLPLPPSAYITQVSHYMHA